MSCVDVVIPCYNYARFLPQCVESVLNQDGVEVRILIIDDCSCDESESVGQFLADQDSRVEFRRHSVNHGHIATYNEGLLEWASSDYSLLLSADDALAQGALARAVYVMERHPEVGMTCGMGRIIWGEERCPTTEEGSPEEYRVVPGPDFLKRTITKGNGVCTPTAVVRTELQHRLGGYRADLPHSGDMEMWMRFAVHGSMGVLRAVQAYYRRHDKNMSRNYDSQIIRDSREVVQACEQVLNQWGARFQDSVEWREMMLQRIAKECCWAANCSFEKGDMKGYRFCVDFAEQIYPDIRKTRAWLKLSAKAVVGHQVWQRIMPAWERFRQYRDSLQVRLHPTHSQDEQLTGWWPGLTEN